MELPQFVKEVKSHYDNSQRRDIDNDHEARDFGSLERHDYAHWDPVELRLILSEWCNQIDGLIDYELGYASFYTWDYFREWTFAANKKDKNSYEKNQICCQWVFKNSKFSSLIM